MHVKLTVIFNNEQELKKMNLFCECHDLLEFSSSLFIVAAFAFKKNYFKAHLFTFKKKMYQLFMVHVYHKKQSRFKD